MLRWYSGECSRQDGVQCDSCACRCACQDQPRPSGTAQAGGFVAFTAVVLAAPVIFGVTSLQLYSVSSDGAAAAILGVCCSYGQLLQVFSELDEKGEGFVQLNQVFAMKGLARSRKVPPVHQTALPQLSVCCATALLSARNSQLYNYIVAVRTTQRMSTRSVVTFFTPGIVLLESECC